LLTFLNYSNVFFSGETKHTEYVSTGEQAEDLKTSTRRLMTCFSAAVHLEDDDTEDPKSLAIMLQTVKLHHITAHAADDIQRHGHAKQCSTQVRKQ